MATARLQTKRLVGMPAKCSIVSAALPMSAQSCYVSFAGVSPTQRGHKWDRNPVGANLS